MLHIINKTPYNSTVMECCVRSAKNGSPILLFEDGIYAAMAGTAYEARLIEIMADHPVYALKEDIDARGIDKIIPGIKLVDYSGFVELVEQHKTCTWL